MKNHKRLVVQFAEYNVKHSVPVSYGDEISRGCTRAPQIFFISVREFSSYIPRRDKEGRIDIFRNILENYPIMH